MVERVIEEQIFKMDFIDLNILELIIKNDYSIDMPRLCRKLQEINVWNSKIIKRRLVRLKEMKIVYYVEKTNPLIIEVHEHNNQNFSMIKELLKTRLLRNRY